ncbi:anaerobic ribonucleoside-triphosphate reductase activating protein [Clostridium hydrogeniformans]|uniref:anaerobic ribonucleoside-triphosphate reductase activating protein n=1 Tax=Clostridium hydrogeniformans TaxID=349933 RepID=UPI00048A0F45|nr:anaerobic ribonucleoside-triphosphate reductase activating protein [Clostridium hydrogeniformans]
MDGKIRLSGMIHESLVNGPGIRRVFFSQGCTHNCKGCFNKETHSFYGGEEFLMDKLIEDVRINPIISGITFSGGDPMEQADKFSYMAKKFRELNLSIWCYTGYTFEALMDKVEEDNNIKELLYNIDVLIDGRFCEENQVEGLKYRGSSNQRVIDIKKTLSSGEVSLYIE